MRFRIANSGGVFWLLVWLAGGAPAALVRQANTTLQMPANPPATSYVLENAFPGLSFSQPVAIATPPGENNRVFVNEKAGRIQVVPDLSAATPARIQFLDLRTLVNARANETFYSSSEGGLLGLAFHPGYATNRQFFVFYTVQIGGVIYDRVSRFLVSAGDANAAEGNSELVLIEQLDQAGNHNGGDLHFGPADGYLYVALGDEGGANDNFNNSQKIDADFFAGIIRIDVDQRPGNLLPTDHPAIVTHNGNPVSAGGVPNYLVPADNPWVGATTFNGAAINTGALRAEWWAVGLRNPWRFSFDPQTHEMYIADVGQNQREEINLGTAGANYGWDIFEASLQRSTPPGGFAHAAPIYEYNRGSGTFQGNSVTGGIVYRGSRHPELRGKYIFADYVSGNVWSLSRTNGVQVDRLLGEGGIATFGHDPGNGDILIGDLNNNQVKRLVKRTSSSGFPQRLSDTGVFADLGSLIPNAGIVPYEPNVSFWSDHALKTRWFSVPNLGDTIGFNAGGNWSFPVGTVWIKHFDLELTRGNPETSTRVETRLLVQTTNGVYGVSYKWNAQGTDADLVEDAGEDIVYQVNEGGNLRNQTWRIPSRAECLACHTDVGGGALSFNTLQLNGIGAIGGATEDRLSALHNAGYFSGPISDTSGLEKYSKHDDQGFPLDHRARSYLAVNCVQCHQAGGPTPANWDARFALDLAQMGLVNAVANNSGTQPAWRLLTPGNPAESILLHRIAATAGFTRMPNLGSNEPDTNGINLVTAWIHSLGGPAITTQPRSQTIASGAMLSLTVAADGDNLAYQWRKDGAPINGATGAALTLVAVQTSDSGNYDVVITNAFGSATSAVAVVNVVPANSLPVITTQPMSADTAIGEFVILSVAVTGQGPFVYQWFKDGSALAGQRQNSLALFNLQLADTGDYTVVVSNAIASVTSQAARLNVLTPTLPVITSQPQDQTVAVGGMLSLNLGVTGVPTPSVFWTRGGAQVGTGTNLVIPNVTLAHAGAYRATAANSAGTAFSAEATVTVLAPPLFTAQPVSQIVPFGANVTFSATAIGSPPIGFFWRRNGADLGAANAPTLFLPQVRRAQEGVYSVVASNAVGWTTSTGAVLRVLVPQRLQTPAFVDGRFRLRFGDHDGGLLSVGQLGDFEIQALPDLNGNWVVLSNAFVLTNGLIQFEDTNAGLWPRRFYRVIEK